MVERLLKLAVFASGRGSNFQSILDAVDRGELELDVVLCLSDRRTAGALERAERHRVPTVVISPVDYETEETYANAMAEALDRHDVNFIALAGYLKKIPPRIIRAYRQRIINVHPALLPAFGGQGMYGRRVHEAVVEYGVHWTGATVHVVEEDYDTGPVVLQEPVPVLPDDTPEDVAARVLRVEHRLYPAALRLFVKDRIRFEGRRVRILEGEDGGTTSEDSATGVDVGREA